MLVYGRVLPYTGLWPGTAVYWSMACYRTNVPRALPLTCTTGPYLSRTLLPYPLPLTVSVGPAGKADVVKRAYGLGQA